jgi:hypothetical protein
MSDYLPENPLIVQSDQSVLLEVHYHEQTRSKMVRIIDGLT